MFRGGLAEFARWCSWKGVHEWCFRLKEVFFNQLRFFFPHTQWSPEMNHYCPGVSIILVCCKKGLRNDPDVIERLRKKGQRPISSEGVRTSPISYISWPIVANDNCYRVWPSRNRLARCITWSVRQRLVKVLRNCFNTLLGRHCWRLRRVLAVRVLVLCCRRGVSISKSCSPPVQVTLLIIQRRGSFAVWSCTNLWVGISFELCHNIFKCHRQIFKLGSQKHPEAQRGRDRAVSCSCKCVIKASLRPNLWTLIYITFWRSTFVHSYRHTTVTQDGTLSWGMYSIADISCPICPILTKS
jgi:hypothetical protein